jgi:formylglycine-generating enzyme required for sulfatase activity
MNSFNTTASVVAVVLAAAPVIAEVEFQWVTIREPGNPADPLTGFGSVAYEYQIATTEVSNAQYAEFLNRVAATDPNGLYSSLMLDAAAGGIVRSGASGTYSYSVVPGREHYPVTGISFFDAMRFVNWLHNGQGVGGTESGAYTIASGLSEVRSPGARYFLPSENEWYKAAFFQPVALGGDVDSYWAYPTSRNSRPVAGVDATFANMPGGTSPVATYSPNYFGLYDMGGNVWEWNEAVIAGTGRGRRGGTWDQIVDQLSSSPPMLSNPNLGEGSFPVRGFRVAKSVLAPCSADVNGVDGVTVQDIFDFLAAWQLGLTSADFNGAGGVTVQDIFDFLTAWNAGCN